jgi:hypothetical protein
MKNCLNGISLNTGSAGTTNCPNCTQSSYYYTIIGESTFDVPQSVPMSYNLIDDGVEPMTFTVQYAGRVVVEFTCNIKRLTIPAGDVGIYLGVSLNGIPIVHSVTVDNIVSEGLMHDAVCQCCPIDVVVGDVIEIVSGCSAIGDPEYQISNHNMRVIYIDN